MARQRTIFLKHKAQSSPYRILVWMGFILIGFMVYRAINIDHSIKPFFSPTPTPTRTVRSFQTEADTYFKVGDLEKAIASYQEVIRQNPNNPDLLAQLARIEVYSSEMLATDQEKLDRLNDALKTVNQALQIENDSSQAHAVKAFVLDWLASNALVAQAAKNQNLEDAFNEATHATTLDPNNAEALAYSAEILADRKQWVRADQVIQQALDRDQASMDAHRIYGYVLTTMAEYEQAISEYQKATEIYPNLTFLYIDIGQLQRHLWSVTSKASDPEKKSAYFDAALASFTKAANINNNIGVKDPIPFMAIARSLGQRGDLGDFFDAQIYMKKALQINPTNPDVYAQLGIIYQQSRNFEGAIGTFKCALEGCTGTESCDVRRDCATNKDTVIQGMPLSDTTLTYYYTYGSVLAGMSKPGNTYCVSAANVFAQLTKLYGKDPNVMAIVHAGENICSAAPETPSATSTAGGPTHVPAAPSASPLPSLTPARPKSTPAY
ncbi:MAG TPA: tetratricopeptide repeat protein [Anaerolineaceae bacterium]|jgi:tetratricopeptide (TPR) repeat protein